MKRECWVRGHAVTGAHKIEASYGSQEAHDRESMHHGPSGDPDRAVSGDISVEITRELSELVDSYQGLSKRTKLTYSRSRLVYIRIKLSHPGSRLC